MPLLRILLLFLGYALPLVAFSQTNGSLPADSVSRLSVDSAQVIQNNGAGNNTVFKDSARLALERLPRIAWRRSAIVPGWGQVTNKRWWKVPLIYGGFVSFGLMFEFYYRLHGQILAEEQYRYNNKGERKDPDFVRADDFALQRGREGYRRNRDLAVLGAVTLYALNIIDAYVDAKFFRFDISDELGVKVVPAAVPSGGAYSAFAPGLKIKLSL